MQAILVAMLINNCFSQEKGDDMQMTAPAMPDISLQALMADPYPDFVRIRDTASAVWVDCARINLVTRFDDILTVERDNTIFASTNPVSMMNTVMGHSLMRKDGEPHKLERAAVEPSFRPGVVKKHWSPIFSEISTRLIDGFVADGQADLFDSFAAPMASLALIEMLGIKDVTWQDMAGWSQSLDGRSCQLWQRF